mgnify:CR=1 FL=1
MRECIATVLFVLGLLVLGGDVRIAPVTGLLVSTKALAAESTVANPLTRKEIFDIHNLYQLMRFRIATVSFLCNGWRGVRFTDPQKCAFVDSLIEQLQRTGVKANRSRPSVDKSSDPEIWIETSARFHRDMLRFRRLYGTVNRDFQRTWNSSVKDITRGCASIAIRRTTSAEASLIVLSADGADLPEFQYCVVFATLEFLGVPLPELLRHSDRVTLTDRELVILCLLSGGSPLYSQLHSNNLNLDSLVESHAIQYSRCIHLH